MRTDGIFIGIEVDDEALKSESDLAKHLDTVCPVDIYKEVGDGGLEIVERNVDECVLCKLCLDVAHLDRAFHALFIRAPWVESEELARQLNSYKLEGVVFRPKTFSPDSLVDGIKIHPPKFLGEKVPGVEMQITDRNAFRSAEAGVYILHALLTLYPEEFEWREGRIDGLLGTSAVREQLQAGVHPDEIVGKWKKDISEFTEKRKKYLIY